MNKICDECETVAHCTKHGCVPKQPAPVQEPAFHGFMDEEECCVNICYTPWAPGGPNNELPTAYYTTPPAAKRQWVGLTDDERLEVAEIDGADEWFWKVCKAIEAKIKEKNNG